MNHQTLLQYFDRISEAPDVIPRLRRFILDLAVRGKLVEQDPQDETASKLLKRIQAEKTRRIMDGELRSPRSLDWADEIEEIFSLPKSWRWIRLADVGAIIGGGTPPSGDYENFADGGTAVAWLTPADLGKYVGLYVSHGARDLTVKGLKSSSATLMPKNSVLFTSRAPIGYTAIAANEITTNQGFKSVVPYIVECSRYIAAYLQAFGPWIDSKASGTTFREVSGKIVSGLPFPLPPLAEQQRIVAKVDELMALCDQLEAARNEREARRQRLTAASLHRLNQPVDAAALRADARFYLDNLTRLTTRPEQIKQLRQTILNLAVRGCLVPQDPKDEPASELLKRIAVERAAGRKIQVPEKNSGENLPVGWDAANLSNYALDVCTGPFGSALHQSDYIKNGIPLVNPSHMVNDRIVSDEMVSVPLEIAERLSSYRLEPGDVVMARRGEVGRAALVEPRQKGWLCGTGSFYLRFSQEINRHFFLLLLRSTQFRSYLAGKAVGTTMVNLNHNILNNARLQIPPLAEQHRIVARVDELMTLCDQLEVQLTTTATDSHRFLEAVLRDALAESE